MNGFRGFLKLASAAALVGMLGGCMAAGEDAASAVSEDLCTSGGLVADVPNQAIYQATPGTLVTWTGLATCAFASPQYQFWARPPAGAWTIVQAYSTSSTYAWNTTALPVGGYDWQVWVREAGSTDYTETYGARQFVLSSTDVCTAVSSSAAPATSAAVGQPVAITGTANCGTATPTYQFWHLAPGGTWQVDQAYSTSATYNWNTTGATVGTHQFQIWARAQGSTASYETYVALSYLITSTTSCQSATVSASPPSGAPRGTLVTWTAGSSACGSPTYQFWLQAPGSGWAIAQAYSASPTFAWDTTSGPSGNYNLQVWVRESGATTAYETYAGATYSLGSVAVPAANNLAAGLYHTCIRRADTTVNCWGNNTHGEIGNGTVSNTPTPAVVSGLSGVTAISAGYTHTCAIVSGGAVNCWGENNRGQLGNGTTANATTPVAVSGISSAVALTGGAGHTCAVLNDATVRCWGFNTQGQVGSGTVALAVTTPVAVAGVSGVVAIEAGYYHTCALLATGGIRCWGGNEYGQLGNGTTTNSLSPVSVVGLADVRSISLAGNESCAVLFDRTAVCWGDNRQGQLGNGTTTISSSPVAVSGLSSVASVEVGFAHGCAALIDGTTRCWGTNTYGALGNGTTTNSLVPVTVSGLVTAASIITAGYHSCAQLVDSSARCWGYGNQGELGNGVVLANSSLPVTVLLP